MGMARQRVIKGMRRKGYNAPSSVSSPPKPKRKAGAGRKVGGYSAGSGIAKTNRKRLGWMRRGIRR